MRLQALDDHSLDNPFVLGITSNRSNSFNTGFTGADTMNNNNSVNPSFNSNTNSAYPTSCRDIYDNHQRSGARTKLPDTVYSVKPDSGRTVITVCIPNWLKL